MQIDRFLLQRLRDLSVEAADALWVHKEGKTPDRDPILINQEIHGLRPQIDAILQSSPHLSAQDFVRYALKIGAITFVPTELKSGRLSPYFFNAGLFNTGESISGLAGAFASAMTAEPMAEFDPVFDKIVVFGPAYKGISIVTAVAMALYKNYGINVGYAFNRKEEKDHGEGGRTVGHPLKGRGVIITDDTMTTGGSCADAFRIVRQEGGNPIGCVIAFDREERGTDSALSAVQTFEQEYGIRMTTAATLTDLITVLQEDGPAIPNGSEILAKILDYRNQYGGHQIAHHSH